MAEVFISYARENLEFARKLVRKLEEKGIEVGFDLDDFLAGEPFWPRIRRLIDEADAVVVLVTPALLGSEPCRREVAYAADGHKRILPVLHVDVDEDLLPSTLAELQWLFLRAEGDLDSGLTQLVAAIAVDPAWVRQHSALLVRARDWQTRENDDALLLRGRPLAEAETFLVQGAGVMDPKPTELQAEFVLAGRRRETRRGRVRLVIAAAVSTGLAVATAAAVVQWRRAEHETQIARAQAMAARAQLALVVDPVANERGTASPERSALLAIGSLRIWPTVEGDAALRNALARLPTPPRPAWLSRETSDAVDPPPAPESVSSPDGRYRARAPGGPGEPVVVEDLPLGRRIELPHEWNLQAMRFTPDSRSLVTVTGLVSMDASDPAATALVGSTVRVWEVGAWRERTKVSLAHTGGIVETAFSPDGTVLATFPQSGGVTLWTLPPDALLREACARLARNPSPSEQVEFGLRPDVCPELPIVSE